LDAQNTRAVYKKRYIFKGVSVKGLICVFLTMIFISGCVSKRPINLNDMARIGVYSSVTDTTNNNIWDENTARTDGQIDIFFDVDWGIKKKIESSLSNAAEKRWSKKLIIIDEVEASLSAADHISYGFSSVYEKYIPALTEVKNKYSLDVLLIAKPSWRYYHGETPLYNKGIGVQSFEDGLSGHVAIDIFAIDLNTMKIIFPAVQDGITMKPFLRTPYVSSNDAEVNRETGEVIIKPAYMGKVFSEIDSIVNWYMKEVPISFVTKKI
jgi:hypothetical protein